MISKKLDVHTPIITHRPQDSILLSIIGNNDSEYSWIMNNFINIRMNKYTLYEDFYREDMWYNCYLIQDNAISKEFITELSNNDFCEFLMSSIDSGFYVLPYLNMKCIKAYNQKYDYRHSPLIYGYDSNRKEFNIADHFNDGVFSFSTASFDEIRASFDYIEDNHEWYKYKLFRCIKKKVGYEYKFSINDLIYKLKEYSEGKNLVHNGYYQFQTNESEEKLYFNMLDHYKMEYGINCYSTLCDMLELHTADVRQFYLIYSHKLLMKYRIEYLIKRYNMYKGESLLKMSEVLLKESLIIRNMFIKYEIKKDILSEEYLYKIKIKLNELKKKDYLFVNDLIFSLERL